MPSEIRVDTIKSKTGIGTVVINDYGQVISGITTMERISIDAIIEMKQEITKDYLISTSRNALSVGPVTIAAGIAVTVPSGSSWTIV